MRRLFGFLPFVDDRTIRRETAELLKRIRSEIPAEARTVARLSGGQRQAVAIARAIYWQAKVVLLDEPTAALAVMERERVIHHTRDLAAHGVGVIYIGHNLTEILKVADRIVVMFRGRTGPRHACGGHRPGDAHQIHDRLHRIQESSLSAARHGEEP